MAEGWVTVVLMVKAGGAAVVLRRGGSGGAPTVQLGWLQLYEYLRRLVVLVLVGVFVQVGGRTRLVVMIAVSQGQK